MTDTVALNGRATLWMLGATLPVAVIVTQLVAAAGRPDDGGDTGPGAWFGQLMSAAAWAVLFDLVAALFVLVAAFVSLPLTYGLGRALQRVRSPWVHVVATAALAGSLAALPLLLVGETPLDFAVPVPLAAGAAGALARSGQLRRTTTAVQRRDASAPA
jgi:hypothetical protein